MPSIHSRQRRARWPTSSWIGTSSGKSHTAGTNAETRKTPLIACAALKTAAACCLERVGHLPLGRQAGHIAHRPLLEVGAVLRQATADRLWIRVRAQVIQICQQRAFGL